MVLPLSPGKNFCSLINLFKFLSKVLSQSAIPRTIAKEYETMLISKFRTEWKEEHNVVLMKHQRISII